MTSGWIILDKPEGLTSTKAGSIVKRLFKQKKLGHAGTLDPFASGVLPLALGEATKVMPYVVSDIKEYEFEITFGEERDSGDLEGAVTATTEQKPTEEQLRAIIPNFIGTITQIPPMYSALWINGQRAYELARRGETVDMKARQVLIQDLVLLSFSGKTAVWRVVCGTGTYVRSLGQDLARAVGSLGYLSKLRRTRVGKFSLQDAVNIDTLKNNALSLIGRDWLLPIRVVLDDIPAIPVSAQQAVHLRHGRSIECPGYEGTVLILSDDQELALCKADGQQLHPTRVFNL
ncbi:MAG: tRNA pseudouridine(55) synthase TruB [Candidatus Paracaedibacteraceae bacterium]|nr:tRNA pseudouridine(55) synthase TruB [Candidatus Paracaedibacteraceae bacterium]